MPCVDAAGCLGAVQAAETFVSSTRDTENGGTSHLEMTWTVLDTAALRDGLDPQIVVVLRSQHFLDGVRSASELTELGRFLWFEGFERIEPGRYAVTGAVFDDSLGCPARISVDVDARAHTVALRAGEPAPSPFLTETLGESCLDATE
ncbi:hypothetical protein [Jannaschia marina]|uniref:hypothetical protein n=1 Tax=Jannaschia marina TaxID=2741674 RepID=UPI0015C7A394|nr:hypothetical protein [Jannaschia marina]